MIIIRSNDEDRREYGDNPHAVAFARARGLSLDGGERHAEVIARMHARQMAHDRQQEDDLLHDDDDGQLLGGERAEAWRYLRHAGIADDEI